MGYKSRSVYTVGNSNDDVKCFRGEKCKNYKKKCSICDKIQGKYTKYEEK